MKSQNRIEKCTFIDSGLKRLVLVRKGRQLKRGRFHFRGKASRQKSSCPLTSDQIAGLPGQAHTHTDKHVTHGRSRALTRTNDLQEAFALKPSPRSFLPVKADTAPKNWRRLAFSPPACSTIWRPPTRCSQAGSCWTDGAAARRTGTEAVKRGEGRNAADGAAAKATQITRRHMVRLIRDPFALCPSL